MKKYVIRIRCSCFEDIEVEANSKEEAEEEALKEYNCPGNCPEVEK